MFSNKKMWNDIFEILKEDKLSNLDTEMRQVVGSILVAHSRKCHIYYFHFLAIVSRQSVALEFRHSTRNASRIRRKVENRKSFYGNGVS